MPWLVLEHPEFARERAALDADTLDKLAMVIRVIEEVGPHLGRPLVDTLKGSRHTNMKELRVAKGAWRFAFAFDPERRAIVLCGGSKEGVSQTRFYRTLISTADARYDEWLQSEGD
ncbi:type II toxin-antitoxin system RelE/ParE family toxin [Arvimicrobium flavum]|uniref:type II toxin-antitoxin system RelE/ParE family toxin n=1 Tax=Arvimicrobium flavum TaxID=3393320 RepID=UPI00237AEE20|nr:type II toxin-antitoxin system RelE/ParE family toxin [Mesorhizobium shangrilense]